MHGSRGRVLAGQVWVSKFKFYNCQTNKTNEYRVKKKKTSQFNIFLLSVSLVVKQHRCSVLMILYWGIPLIETKCLNGSDLHGA
jgi:hypothetical protein